MKLLYKEWALAAHPTLYIFTLLGCLVMVPAYPYTVIFMFGCLAPYITFTYARETNDAFYTATLPVTKRDIVKAKCMLFMSVQLGQLLISIPFALLRETVGIAPNPVGMDPNAAWYGIGLIIYGGFDLVFLPTYYRSGYKAGRAFTLAMIPVILIMATAEVSAHIPALAFLKGDNFACMMRRLPLLGCGILLYIAAMAAAFRISARRFDRVDL